MGEQLNPENTADENQSGADQKRPLTAEEVEAILRSRLEVELAQPRVNNDPVTQIKFEFGMTSSEDAGKGREKFDVFIDQWLKFPNVAPRNAALVLCMKDPICDKGQEPVKFITGVGSRDFKWMLIAFKGIAKHDKLGGVVRSRTLLDWRDHALSQGLKYHPWFDRYEQPSVLPAGTMPKPIPGKLPNVSVGKLAVKAAWLIECELNRAASCDSVMERLQQWADNATESDTLVKPEKAKHGVTWQTKKGKTKLYDVEACGKTLVTWRKSRA